MVDDILVSRDTLDLGLDLLDRLILDSTGEPCGRVDDLELELRDDVPVVTAILTNPGALATRLGGRVGSVIAHLWRRFHDLGDPRPIRIPWDLVVRVDFAVHIAVERHEFGLTRSEEWARTLLDKVPGL
ncbi:MAG TPA: hypothetical protein VFK89_11100 [Actinomycetota bacterium]|nr:hypothetical protein [Actinomycetota bacterium]